MSITAAAPPVTLIHETVHTPHGPFTVVEEDGVVVASAWSADVTAVTARAGQARSVPGKSQAADAVVAYYQGDTQALGRVRIGPSGTPFRMRVWQALRDIPAGQTRTYGELADQLGSPGASRAVGGACGANAIALFIPCHRVSGADGKLTGFAWGVDIKRSLLDREAAARRN